MTCKVQVPHEVTEVFWHAIMLGLVNACLIDRRDCKLFGVHNTETKELPGRGRHEPKSLVVTPKPSITQCQISTTTVQQSICWSSRWCSHWPSDTLACEMWQARLLKTLQNQYNHYSLQECDVRLCFTEEWNSFKSHHLTKAKRLTTHNRQKISDMVLMTQRFYFSSVLTFFCTIYVYRNAVWFSLPIVACCKCPQIGSVIYFDAAGIFCDAKYANLAIKLIP